MVLSNNQDFTKTHDILKFFFQVQIKRKKMYKKFENYRVCHEFRLLQKTIQTMSLFEHAGIE